MSMLTAANVSTPDIAKAVRQGTQSIEGMLKNTTNIPDGVDIASKVKDAMQTGAAAAERVTKIKTPTTTTTTTDADGTVRTITTSGGGSTTTTNPVIRGETRTAKPYDPYNVPNGGKIKDIDDQIDRLNKQKFEAHIDGRLTPVLRKNLNDGLTRLYAQRDILRKQG